MDRRIDTTTPVTNIFPLEPSTPLGRLNVSETDLAVPLVPVTNCTCLVCQAFVSQWAVDQLEIHIMDLVADLLDHGWEPASLAAEVDQLAVRGPSAEQIVKLALVSHAGYWMSDPAMFELLDEVDELADGLNHAVGLTIPGWLNRYANEDIEFGSALNGVADVFEILPLLPCPSATPTRTSRDGSVWDAWQRHRP